MMIMIITHLAWRQAEVHDWDVNALSRRNFDYQRIICSAAPSGLKSRQAGEETTRRW